MRTKITFDDFYNDPEEKKAVEAYFKTIESFESSRDKCFYVMKQAVNIYFDTIEERVKAVGTFYVGGIMAMIDERAKKNEEKEAKCAILVVLDEIKGIIERYKPESEE